MPQLIAMVIVVVGAMIYMFQTFGGTGDKIEGIAQKASIITEINNIKDGLKVAADTRNGARGGVRVNETLEDLGEQDFFTEQINEQLTLLPANGGNGTADDSNNVYQALSFGAGDVNISLVTNVAGRTPGIFVNLSQGTLNDNAAFLEAQIANDLGNIATIDRNATTATAVAGTLNGATEGIDSRIPAATAATDGSDEDGMFTVYFREIPLAGATR